jgi:hypothetical protein
MVKLTYIIKGERKKFATQEHRFHSYVVIIHNFGSKHVRVAHNHKKRPIPFTLNWWCIEYIWRPWYLLILGWIFWVSLNIYITPKDKYKTTFCDRLGNIHIGSYAFWNKKWTTDLPKSYEQRFQGIFKHIIFKVFLDNFTVYSDMDNNLFKLKLCFDNLNFKNYAFMVFSRIILRFIVSKEGKLLNPKKIHTRM